MVILFLVFFFHKCFNTIQCKNVWTFFCIHAVIIISVTWWTFKQGKYQLFYIVFLNYLFFTTLCCLFVERCQSQSTWEFWKVISKPLYLSVYRRCWHQYIIKKSLNTHYCTLSDLSVSLLCLTFLSFGSHLLRWFCTISFFGK